MMTTNSSRNLPKILIVDDQAEYAELVAEVAEANGFDATTLTNSEKFEQALAMVEYDFIVLDLVMPGKDGIELLRYLAEIGSTVRLVLMSGYDRSVLNVAHELAHEHSLNIIDILHKPFRLNEIATILLKGMENQSAKKNYYAQHRNLSVADIINALDNDEFCYFYQPQIALHSNNMSGMEALARWQHPEHGTIGPMDFISFIEENGLIDKMTMKLIDKGLQDLTKINGHYGDITLSINISTKQLSDLRLPDVLHRKVLEHKLSPERIIIEVTESGIISDLKVALDILARFRMKGFKLSIDDFGTGSAMYEQLRRLPITELKIDRSFTANCLKEDKSLAIVEQTISLAQRLNISTVAEGVENEGIESLLKQLGCDLGQGYFYSKPLPFEALFS